MNADLAGLGAGLRWRREDNGHIGSTTALGVLNNRAGLLAGSLVLADGLIRKGIVELEVDVELDGNL